MPRRARIHYVSIRSSLVNLPISIYGPLLERSVRPQNLAVHLTLADNASSGTKRKAEAYVGWTGMASASSLAQFNSRTTHEAGLETIDIDPQYAQGLGFYEDDVVEIGLLHDLQFASSVGTEPLSSDDWEIIELHASHVEATLLSQVRVAKINQEIDVWILGRTRVRLRVVSLAPSSRSDALLLTTDTEVSIAPKPHGPRHKANSANGVPISAQKPAGKLALSSEKPHVDPSGRSIVLRVLPARFCPLQDSEWNGPERIAYVSVITGQLLKDLRLTESHESKLVCSKFSYERLLPPQDVDATSTATAPTDTPPHVLHPSSEGDKKGVKELAPHVELPGIVYVGFVEGIVDNHIVFPVLPSGVEDWDLVHLKAERDLATISLPLPDVPAPVSLPSPVKQTTSLAGVEEILERISTACLVKYATHSKRSEVLGASGLLLVGRAGSGKTSIAKAVTESLEMDPRTHAYVHFVDASRFSTQSVPKVKAQFKYWFEKAAWHRPSVLVLDNLDKLLGAETEHAESFRSRQLTELFLREFSDTARVWPRNFKGIFILATTSSTASLHPRLNSSHVFQETVNIKGLNKNSRRDILELLVKQRLKEAPHLEHDLDTPVNYTALATQTEGYSASDLVDLTARAMHQVAIKEYKGNSSPRLSHTDFSEAQIDFVPLSLRDVKLQKSEISWADIGGLHETRRTLRETLEWPTKYGPIFAQSPLRLRSGLLLYGYPGCGKTLLASAVAKECGLNFISVKGPEILNKYIGASEQSVRDLFERASSAKPCVLFFDEFDSIAPKRGHDSTGVTDRVVNQMLTQMDGAEGLDGVYVLAATSRPDLIDSALLRPGRLDKSLLCPMPGLEDRKDILRAVATKLHLSPSVRLDEVAEETDGFSGADLQALLYNANLEVIHTSIADQEQGMTSSKRDDELPIPFFTIGEQKRMTKAEESALQSRLRQIQSNSRVKNTSGDSETKKTPAKPEIGMSNIKKVLQTMRPSVTPEERKRLERIYREFVSDRQGGLPAPPEAGGLGNRATLA